MNKHSSIRASGSLLERASAKFDFAASLRGGEHPLDDLAPPANDPAAPVSFDPVPAPLAPPVRPVIAPRHPVAQRQGAVDRVALSGGRFITPDTRPGSLAEEFRIVKRQLLLAAAGQDGAIENGRMILVSSSRPDEGKTFCSLNLALSMAREPELDVVLVDGDFAKPELVRMLGLEDGPGLLDALADPSIDVESCVIATDIANLSVLPAGLRRDDATELLASSSTREVLDRLIGRSPHRIVIFDSPPALATSVASGLALHAGQTIVVVKADQTSEADLREAIALLDGCDRIQLLLNGTSFGSAGRRFGAYYGYGDET